MSSGIPHTLEECFIVFKGMLGEEGVGDILEMEQNAFVVAAHHGLGRRIRNAWGLWSGSELKTHLEGLGLTRPDDMSGVILTSFWRHLHGIPLDVEGQVEHYRAFYETVK